MLKLDVLLSAYKMSSIKELKLAKKNIGKNLIIVNQMMDKEVSYISDGVEVYDVKEKGISASRNLLIELSQADICVMTDDDISFSKDYREKLLAAYAKYPEADVITFNLKKGKDIYGFDRDKKLNYIDLFRILAVQISFRRDKIITKNIRYDENFGIGSGIINIGEENVFLTDCYKKGLKIYHIAQTLVEHPDEDTTGEKWTVASIEDRAATAKRTLGIFSFSLFIYTLITKRKFYRKVMSTKEFVKAYYRGYAKYKKIRKR